MNFLDEATNVFILILFLLLFLYLIVVDIVYSIMI